MTLDRKPVYSSGRMSIEATDQITVGSERIGFKVTSEQSGGDVVVLEVLMPPGGGPPLLHRHDPFELYRVRRGELAIYLEGRDGVVRRRVAGPGEVVAIAGGLEHTIRNESAEEAEAVVLFSPGAAMERLARAAGELAEAGPPSPEEMLALTEAHGIELTRPVEAALAEAAAGYLTIARFSGDADELLDDYRRYAETMDGVGRDHGLVLHAGARTDEGFLVVNLWPSKENSEGAAQDPRRLEVLERARLSPEQVVHRHYHLERRVVFD